MLYDVTTLYLETDAGDGFRESGFSKGRRLEPQSTVGLLTDQAGFPLMISAFEGNTGETKTMVPAIEAFMAAYQLPGVTILAGADMISDAKPVHPARRRHQGVNRELEAKARELAGIKGYHTNLQACPDGTTVTPRVRDRRLPPALRDRELLPDGQKRPAGPSHLPPPT